MFDHLLELSHRDDPLKRSNIRFGAEITKVEWIKEITQVESNEVNFTHFIYSFE